jgi:hypothetical protein
MPNSEPVENTFARARISLFLPANVDRIDDTTRLK